MTPQVSIVRPSTFDLLLIDRLDDAELDELPFGVVCLDPSGTILRYNIAEARLARLDRNTVLGRPFFGEVAPCTRTPEFEGRFRSFVSGQLSEQVLRFEYLFDFKFGAQRVEVEIVRAASTERFYLVISRREFRPPRTGLAPGFAAPRHEELVTPESEVGVARDTREQREVRAPAIFFEALLRTCERVAPDTWPIFCREWGVEWGRRTVVDLETRCLEETTQSLRERPMVEVAERVAMLFLEQGWGDLSFDFGLSSEGGISIALAQSPLANASRRKLGRRCDLVAGMVGAVLTHLAGRKLHVEELRCRAEGHPRCEFLAVGGSRAERLAELARTSDDPRELLARLGGRDGR
jgi:photoactive yellow protein